MKINRDEYLLHINKEEDLQYMKRVLDLIEITINKHINTHTDFLEPNMLKLSQSVLNRFEEINYSFVGGFTNAERKIISIYNSYKNYCEIDVPLKAFKINIDTEKILHKDVLGSILALGISRDKIGDIEISEGEVTFVVLSEISDFVFFNLKKIKNENVTLEEKNIKDLGTLQKKGKMRFVISSSLRIDSVVSEVYNLSRDKSKKLINSGLVKLNYSPETKIHKTVDVGDLISVRRKGRFEIVSIDGLTKKDRIKFTIFEPE